MTSLPFQTILGHYFRRHQGVANGVGTAGSSVVTLARSAREGGLSVLDFLLRHRLSATNAFSPGGGGGSAGAAAARRKALRLVTAICSRGPSDFKREAARSASGAIR